MGFLGYSSRMNPVSLQPGMLQLSENMRLDRGVAVTRKGAKRLASDISVSGTPLSLDFILSPAPNEPIVRSVYSGGDDDVRRAMSKSFVESKGEVLSTSWSDVGAGKMPGEDCFVEGCGGGGSCGHGHEREEGSGDE